MNRATAGGGGLGSGGGGGNINSGGGGGGGGGGGVGGGTTPFGAMQLAHGNGGATLPSNRADVEQRPTAQPAAGKVQG
jgi:hypothetical protein